LTLHEEELPMSATFIEHFSDLKDPRDDKNKKHQFTGQARNNFYEINKISWLQDKYDVTL
jgi:hypothetical protein